MVARLKQGWRELRRGEPGRRFRARYERRRLRSGTAGKCLMCALGVLIVLVGIVLLPLPGPGMLIVAFGALLMAEGSLTIAKGLDALELRVRPLVLRLLNSRNWRRPPERSGSR